MINKIIKLLSFTLMSSTALLSSSIVISDESLSSEQIENIVVTATRNEQQQQDIAGAITRSDQEEISLTSHIHINQMGTRFPGTWISRGNGQEHLTSIRSPVFTGSGSCAETLVSEDGLPVRPTGMCNVNQMFEINSEQASGIEVWRGAGTVVHGSNAMHGVFNVISPLIKDNYASIGFGSNNYKNIQLGAKAQYKTGLWQVAANGASDGGYKEDSGYDQQKLSVKNFYSLKDIDFLTHLSVTNLNQETAGYIKGFNSYKDSQSRRENLNPEAFRDAQSMRLSTKVEGNFKGYKWSATPYFRKSKMNFLQHYLPGQPQESNGQYSNGMQTNLIVDKENMDLALGIDLERAKMYVAEVQENILGIANNVRFQGKHYDFEVDSNQYALYANLNQNIQPDTALDVGVRLEKLDYDYSNKMISGTTRDDGSVCNSTDGSCRYFRPDSRSDSFRNLNYQIGILHNLDETTNLFARFATAYRAPQINEIYRLQKEQSMDDIKSQNLSSFEFGIKRYSESSRAEISAYVMNKDNVIIKDTNNIVVNDGQTDHRGIEWLLSYKLSSRLTLTNVGSFANHTYSYSRLYGDIDINGNAIDTAPKLITNLSLKYEDTKNFTSELEIVHLDNYFLDPQNLHIYPGHSIANFRFTKTLKNINLSGQITNLTGKLISERADYGFGSYRYFVGEERGIFIQVQRKI